MKKIKVPKSSIFFILLIICLIVSNMCGIKFKTIQSGSMKPTLTVGSLIITKDVDGSDVNVGDIIIYKRGSSQICHRVLEKGNDFVITKGDANKQTDGKILFSNIISKEIFNFKGFSKVIKFFINPITIIGLLLMICITNNLTNIYKRKEQDNGQ